MSCRTFSRNFVITFSYNFVQIVFYHKSVVNFPYVITYVLRCFVNLAPDV